MTSVTIPNSVTSISEGAFSSSGLTSVVINSNDIASKTYSSSSTLSSIFGSQVQHFSFGNSVTSIGNYAFSGCSGLTSITIPNSVTTIGGSAFYGCSGLTSVTIPNSVTSIGSYAFTYCSGLTSVTIPNSVTSIGDWAFSGCSGLTSITIPNSVTSIGSSTFGGCSGLTSVAIPNRVTSIGDWAFGNCSGLTSVTIPNSVTSIGNYAFYGCSGLTSVTVPNSVTSISNHAFRGCSGLTSIAIPNSVTNIGKSALYNCSGLTSVTIGNSVTSIGDYAFYGCTGLTCINCRATTPPSCGSFFGNFSEDCTLEVPAGCKEAYEEVSPWCFFSIVETTTVTFAAEYGTFCSAKALDFTDVEGVKAYIASVFDTETGELTLTRVKKVKARTGLVLRGTPGQTYEIPEGTGTTVVANLLVGVTEDTELSPTDGNFTNFIMARNDAGNIGFFRVGGTSMLKAGKAYLQLPSDELSSEVKGFRMLFDDGDMSDNVETIHNSQFTIHNEAGAVYDLQGRRVAKPTKGIYIVNGKKTVIR